jgi:hypothetical protein
LKVVHVQVDESQKRIESVEDQCYIFIVIGRDEYCNELKEAYFFFAKAPYENPS